MTSTAPDRSRSRMKIGMRKLEMPAFLIGLCSLLVIGFASPVLAQDPPRYKLDASWPKELPNNWILGHVTGMAVDKDDHIWVLHSPSWVLDDDAGAAPTPPLSECCRPAPAVLEFDKDGNVLEAWGGPEYLPDWPNNEHGLAVDKEGNVWIAGNWTGGVVTRRRHRPGNPKEGLPWDRQVFKFTPAGKLLLEIGHPSRVPANSQDTSLLGGPWELAVDDEAHEVYIADGALNRRVVVYDSNTGAFKRGWGAYGIPLGEVDNSKLAPYDPTAAPARQVLRDRIAAVRISVDGLVYVSRIEVRIGFRFLSKSGQVRKGIFFSSLAIREAGDPPGNLLSPRIRSRNTSSWQTAKTL